IADEVEVMDRSGEFGLWHFSEINDSEGVWRSANRYGFVGFDLMAETFHGDSLTDEEVERIRIGNGIPKWGTELKQGMLPPEAGLDATDISYTKGCYIGQEVISRIKSAGKVNRRLVKLDFHQCPAVLGELVDRDGKICGEVTSITGSSGLGFLKRGMEAGDLSVCGSKVRLLQ
ncbi:MAG: tRNA-modifying protein YgfZ, partial [Armatimonadetes bacterium]|nr:tRNA-modifying protein YgfZ [Akkermansiaceae bacterium]